MTTPDQTADRTRDVVDDVRSMLEKWIASPDYDSRDIVAKAIEFTTSRLVEEIETLRRDVNYWKVEAEGERAKVARRDAKLTAAQEENARLREALNIAEKALRPFYDAVFNDNGDITVEGPYDYEEAIAGYFACKKIRAALSADKPAGGRESVEGPKWRVGFDETEVKGDLPTYGISRYENGKEVHGNQINVYGDPKLRDRLLEFLNSTETSATARRGRVSPADREESMTIDDKGLVERCELTGNPVGTDTRAVGAPPCECPSCRSALFADMPAGGREPVAMQVKSEIGSPAWFAEQERITGTCAWCRGIGTVRTRDFHDELSTEKCPRCSGRGMVTPLAPATDLKIKEK